MTPEQVTQLNAATQKLAELEQRATAMEQAIQALPAADGVEQLINQRFEQAITQEELDVQMTRALQDFDQQLKARYGDGSVPAWNPPNLTK